MSPNKAYTSASVKSSNIWLRRSAGLTRQVLRRSLLRGVVFLDGLGRRQNSNQQTMNESPTPECDFSIVITTFEDRQMQSCLPLIKSLRQNGVGNPLVVVLNGVYGRKVDPSLRADFVKEANAFQDVSFVMSRSMIPLARCWNLGIQMSNSSVCVVLNDDLAVNGRGLLSDLERLAETASECGLALGNGSFSHFALSKDCLSSIGWFDERYLGIGEEDGDYAWRFEDHFGVPPQTSALSSIRNLDDPSRGEFITGIGKYSLANRVFMQMKFELHSGTVKGMFDDVSIRRLSEIDPYPHWRFHQLLEQILSESDEAVIKEKIATLLR